MRDDVAEVIKMNELLKPKICLVPFGRLSSEDIVKDYEMFLGSIKKLDFDLIVTDPVDNEVAAINKGREIKKLDFDLLLSFALHGFTGHLQAKLAEEVGKPVVIWSLPSRYSLPTSGLAYGRLIEKGIKIKHIHALPDDSEALSELRRFATVAAVINKLSKLRLGAIGHPTPPMISSHFNRNVLKDRLGVDVVYITVSDLLRKFREISNKDVEIKLLEIKSKYRVRASEQAIWKAVKLYLALKKIQEELGLDGVAVECYTELYPIFGVNPCLGFIDDQLIGCEMDILNTVGAIIAQYLTNKPALITDPYSVSKDGVVTFIHCAAAASISEEAGSVDILEAEPPSIIKEKVMAVHCRPKVPEGKIVTVFRIYGRLFDTIYATLGRVVSSSISKGVEFKVKIDNPREFINYTTGNHFVVAFGDIRHELKLLSEWLKIKYIET